MSAGHTVHVRVNDAATGQPTPVRIRLEAGGRYCAPFGRLASFATERGVDVGGSVAVSGREYASIHGTCEVQLPPGDITVEISKGPEYSPVQRVVPLAPGQISLRWTIDRWIDWRKQGWYSGDTRALLLPPHAALLEGQAEDLAVVNLLACDWSLGAGSQALPNLLAFSGQQPALEAPGCLVAVNTFNTHPVLGSLGLLHTHRTVYPLTFGGPEGSDDWTLADWCDQCHRKRGLVVWADSPDRLDSEALANALLGRVDAFEVVRFDEPEPAVLTPWYLLLDAGLRLPLAGGSGKDSNAIVLGQVRTYARPGTEEPLSYTGWIDAVRAGRTFVTNGPLLALTADGHGPGEVLEVQVGQPVALQAEAHSQVPFERLELLVNGQVVASKEASGNAQAAATATDLRVRGPAWIAARCWSRERLPDGQCVFAHTTPVYLRVNGQGVRPGAATAGTLLGHLERMAAWVRTTARCPTDKARQDLAGVFEAARAVLCDATRS